MSVRHGNQTASRRFPLIGVTAGWADRTRAASLTRNGDLHYCESAYLRSIETSGGIPVLIPSISNRELVEEFAARLDGLLLTGGEDVHPRRYGQELLFDSCVISEPRDEFEFALAGEFLKTGKPVLGICRGCQLLNVLLDGTLIQDLPNQAGIVHHAQTFPADRPAHEVQLRKDSRVARCFGSTMIEVNSTHHQAVEKIGGGLRVTGWSEEGIVEAFEHRTHPHLMGVQWHPERLASERNGHHHLFCDFVQACMSGSNLS